MLRSPGRTKDIDFTVNDGAILLHPSIAAGGDQFITQEECAADRNSTLTQAELGLFEGALISLFMT